MGWFEDSLKEGPMIGYASIMIIAGIGIPVMAACSSALGRHLGSPVLAASIMFSGALTIAITTLLIQGNIPWGKLATAPKYYLFAGAFIALYVLSITFVAPKFGVGNAVFFVLLGQLISTAIIDHFGFFGARVTPLDGMRVLGIFFMSVGIWLTQKG